MLDEAIEGPAQRHQAGNLGGMHISDSAGQNAMLDLAPLSDALRLDTVPHPARRRWPIFQCLRAGRHRFATRHFVPAIGYAESQSRSDTGDDPQNMN